MKKIIGFICLMWTIIPCLAQSSYVRFDTIVHSGAKIIDQGKRKNALSIQWQKGKDEIVNLTPYEVISYSTDKREYVAKNVEINGQEERFFLEKLADGNLTLFFIKNNGNHFYIEKDNALSELIKLDASGQKRYKEYLQALCADCNYTENFLKHTWYNRYYLERFVKRYNLCEEVYRPVRFGVVGGWDFTGYSMLKDAWGVSGTPSGGNFTFGAFADIPILQGKVSFHPEVLYSKQAYRVTEILAGKYEKEGVANIETYSVPLLLRYTWWSGKSNFFMNFGMVWNKYSRL